MARKRRRKIGGRRKKIGGRRKKIGGNRFGRNRMGIGHHNRYRGIGRNRFGRLGGNRWRHRNRGSSGRRAVYIPSNDKDTQFLARDNCYLYSSRRFDAVLANQRLTKMEVDDSLRGIHRAVDDFNSSKCVTCTFILIFLGMISLLIWNIMRGGFAPYWALVQIFSMFCCFGSIIAWICCKGSNDTTNLQRIHAHIEAENQTKWHPRGLHWSVDVSLAYISIHFNWDIEKGWLQTNAVETKEEQITPQLITPQQITPGQPMPIGKPLNIEDEDIMGLVNKRIDQMSYEQMRQLDGMSEDEKVKFIMSGEQNNQPQQQQIDRQKSINFFDSDFQFEQPQENPQPNTDAYIQMQEGLSSLI